jgi:hypothetical protein
LATLPLETKKMTEKIIKRQPAGRQQYRSRLQRHRPGAARRQPERDRRRHRFPAGNQRCRKDDHAAGHQRPAQAGKRLYQGRLCQVRWKDITNVLGTQVVKLGPSWCRKDAVYSSTSPWMKISGWVPSPARTAARRSARTRTRCTTISPPGQNHQPAGRVLLRRRAADDRHRPGLDGLPKCSCWTNLPWAWPPCWSRKFSKRPAINREMGTTLLVVEQNAKIALESPTMPTSWSPARSSWKGLQRIEKQPGCQGVLHGGHPGRRAEIL